MIQINGVSKTYTRGKDQVPAVHDLSLSVNRGELFGFLGPNGAGKTTTIKMIVGLLRPDRGTISVCGFDSRTGSLKARAVTGYVPDEPLLYEKMTGVAFLSFMADMFRVPAAARSAIADYAGMFELADALKDRIATYSHGMKQKIALIAALIHAPDVLILDEPLVGLDPKASFNLKEVLREFCNKGRTVFFSTHVMEVAEKLCDRLAIIHHGRLLHAASLADLRDVAGKKNASLEQLFLEMTRDDA